MLEKLKAVERRLTEVERQLSDPAVYTDRERLTGDAKNFNIAAVMNGDLDDMIDALILSDQAQRLQESKEE